MNQLWAIQTKLTQEDSTRHLVRAFQDFGLNWAAFPFPPFVGNVPDFRWDGPIIYYGSTALVKRVYETYNLHKSARLWYDEFTHQPTWYGPRFGAAYLNRKGRFVRLGDFLNEDHPFDFRFFARPNSGLKLFAGKVYDFVDFQQFVDMSQNNVLMTLDAQIMVNEEVRQIEREFRTWIVDGEVAAAVQYKVGTKMWPSQEVPEEVVAFARANARECSPSPVFVLDVAQTPDGLAVIEINSFHSSGFYMTEHISDVVAEVSNYVKRTM